MLKVFVNKNNRILFFAIIIIVVFSFAINTKFISKILFAEEEETENPVGWAWNNIFGWHSGNCNGNYYGEYKDFCGISVPTILDVNFDSQDFDFVNNKVKDNSTPESSVTGSLYGITSGNIRNRTGNSNFNQSLYFDGTSSYINFGTNNRFKISDNNSFTISVWFKLDPVSVDDYSMIFSNGNSQNGQYQCYIHDRKIICSISGNSITGLMPIEFNKWYNLTITYLKDIDTLNAYLGNYSIDGFTIDSGYSQEDVNINNNVNNDLLIGKGVISGSTNRYFKGEIDEFRFFGNSLTEEQVGHNMLNNSNYSIQIDNTDGNISGYMWNQGLGWVCLGTTCSSVNLPSGGFSSSLSDTKLNWQGNIGLGIYPNMITGWAKVLNSDPVPDPNKGWISLQGPIVPPTGSRTYSECASCVTRDREDGLVGYWKFDEGSGDVVVDSSGFGRDGRIINFQENNWVLNNCVLNNCFLSNNRDSSVKIDNIEKIGFGDFSFEVWVKMEDYMEKDGYILGFPGVRESNFQMFFNKDSKSVEIDFLGLRITSDESKKVLDKKWHQLVFTADRHGEGKFYLDGTMIKNIDISQFLEEDIQDSKLNIGGISLSNIEALEKQKDEKGDLSTTRFGNWGGEIDVLRMYKRALNQNEVAYNYKYIEKKNCSACFDTIENTDPLAQNICYECNNCYFDIDANASATDLSSSFYKCDTCYRCNRYGLVFDSNTASIKGYAWGGNSFGWLKFGPSLGSGIYRSYVSGRYGNIYSKGNVGSDYSVTPPLGFYNSSYIIQANGHLINWSSESSVTNLFQGNSTTTIPNFNPVKPWLNYFGNPRGYTAPVYDYPSVGNDYGNILGKIDYDKLKQIAIYNHNNSSMPWDTNMGTDVCLGGDVYFKDGNYTLSKNIKFLNASGQCVDASGLIMIEGDLTINNNISYDQASISGSYKSLASVAWIIKGDLIINPNVTNLAGTFIVLGKDDIECGNDLSDPKKKCGTIYTGESSLQLKILGQIIAKNFLFQRTYKDILKSPAELIIYDGRNIINPPIGLGDVVKALPRWDQIAPY